MGGLASPQSAAVLAEAVTPTPLHVNFVCVNVGTKYPMKYVEVLQNMIMRNSTNLEQACAMWCLTDRPDELPAGVYPIAAPDGLPGWWAKLALFSPEMPWTVGDRCVYLDLDVCVTGRLEELVETPGISEDVGWPCYNSSVMVWNHGDHREAWTRFTPDIMTRSPGPLIAPDILPAGVPNGGDQEWLTEVGGWDLLPRGWAVSYRWQSKEWPPTGAKVVQFHGATKPHEVLTGWVPNVWKVNGFTSLPEWKGVNTTHDQRLDNVKSAIQRDLPWFTGFKDEGKTCVVVGGAPSMKDYLGEIRAHRKRGARIVTVNNAWRTLVDAGIMPDVHVMLDARPQNAEFVKGAPKSIRFVLASQCHPDVFDALAEHEVVIWHSGTGDNLAMQEVLKPWWDEGPNQRPCILIPGGSTVGLRCMWLATYSGFRTLHMYGVDSSYSDTGEHHAYAQTLNDGETVLEVVRGEKTYRCAPWMCRQAGEFQESWNDLRNYTDEFGQPSPVTVHVHGVGLLPDIARDLRAEARAA